jgi:acetolactate synthase-1/2/3 large subunit
MLMNNEINTAVSYRAQAVWVVLDDSRYGITHQAMPAQGYAPVETLLPPTDFVQFARSMGADGVRVESEDQLEAALAEAMRHDGPFVVDVIVDPSQITPVLQQRIESLEKQGRGAAEGDRR